MTLFGKESEGLQVLAADFLPDGKRLYILVADDDCNIHIMEYDPEGKGKTKHGLLIKPFQFKLTNFIFFQQTRAPPRAIVSSIAASSTRAISHQP